MPPSTAPTVPVHPAETAQAVNVEAEKADGSLFEQLMHFAQDNSTAVLLGIFLGLVIIVYLRRKPEHPKAAASKAAAAFVKPPQPVQKLFSLEELREFNGQDGKPIYIAIKGVIFDMTSHPSGRDMYGSHGGYGVLSGHDATLSLAKMSLDPADLDGDWSSLSRDELENAESWLMKYQMKYDVVGCVVPNRTFTREELSHFDGRPQAGTQQQRPLVYIAVDGIVFDVSRDPDFSSPEGKFFPLAGHDATRALATGSSAELTQGDAAPGLDDLSPEQKQNIKQIMDKFALKFAQYGVKGRLV